ncbi:MAG TPA: bifunctional salicylyl-CoA 5-hydroxylase/oxidoreductase [Gemmatimonadaceae bacterium]|nr:bifunctional salicylyl-CoA 5-hydroxylase/oxidoreductase [Gemmatimonadaceae bacterium]
MKVVVIGGGPAGLFFACLMKRADRAHHVTVLERNAATDAFGWGVVFSDATLDNVRAADPETYDAIARHFARWDDIDVHVKGHVITSGGHGFSGLARKTLLDVLRARAESLGVELRWGCDVPDDGALRGMGLGDADLVVAADGVNSRVRARHASVFAPDLDARPAKYVWLGTTRLFDAFTFLFVETPDGGVYQAHAYRFDETRSAFIVECDERSWRLAGFDRMDADATVDACEAMFAPWLDGHPLLAKLPPSQRATPWTSFVRVRCERWYDGNVVLLGDAAHTAHFSIGSGTKLAMEDAIALSRALNGGMGDEGRGTGLAAALQAYQDERMTEALRLQNAARNSMEWFENVRRYMRLEPEQFAYSLLTRSQRVSHENLRLRDAAYLGGVERWFASRGAPPHGEVAQTATTERDPNAANGSEPPPPPMFTPFQLRSVTLENRVVVSPMDMYSAEDGTPNDFHLVHLGARALGGAGLIMTEMTCVSPEARITLGCTGMYTSEHEAAWARIVAFVHDRSRSKICLQLGHSGGKGATRLMWEGTDVPLDEGQRWETLAPSAVPYRPTMPAPRAMTRDDMERVRAEFVRATRMADRAGFDMVELHCAHGYLLSAFITPLLNHRDDEYGGALENRLRFPLEVFAAMRDAWPAHLPMSVRISATDWVDDGRGVSGDDAVAIAGAFHAAGADVIHVSTGQTSPDARPVYGRMFQTPYSDRIRNEAGVPTIAVGNITDADQVNSIVAAGRADLCALARPHLADPHWTLHAAAQLGYRAQPWPIQYRTGKMQLERNAMRDAAGRGPGVGEVGRV